MYKQEKKYYKQAFLIAFIMACVLLLPFVIADGGYFVYYGDYNAQQIPFYKTCIEAVQSGNLGWNWQTDLGANFVGSYSFYTLGSPFFWLAALFPVSISQYLMAPLMALKLGLSSLFAFMYIRRFVRKPQSAVIGGILYAFSGFSMYNIFFNHFHEAIVFFPLLLIGLEEAVINKRRGALCAAIALNAFVNYFFFIGECVFLVIYFAARLCCDRRFRISVGDFFCLAFECIAGVLIAGILFVPSIFQVLDVPRSTNILTDSSFLFFNREQRYGLLLEAMFFPPEIPARTNMFTEAASKWSSVALYLPLFSMVGVIAFMKGAKKHWGRAVLAVCLVMAFVPGLNAAFTLFNNNYYTRWFYMPELIMALATVYTLENDEQQRDIRFGLKACAVTVGVMALVVLLHPVETDVLDIAGLKTGEKTIVPYFMEVSPVVYLQLAIAIAFMVVLWIILDKGMQNPRRFGRNILAATVACSMALGYYFVGYGRIIGPYVGSYNKTVSADIHIDDPDFYRMEGLGEINNVNMLWGMSSLKSFTSVIPSSTFQLYEMLGISRDVNSAPDNLYYAFRSLAGVKYLIVKESYSEKSLEDALDELKLYEYHSSQNGYDIYINNYAFPMGFAYDNYVTTEQMENCSSDSKDKLMCRAVVLTDEQAEKYADILSPLETESRTYIGLEEFKQDAKNRIAAGVSSFRITGDGFAARTEYETAELVVFSVPYDSGWSATVNGEPAEVEKVNGGLCAIRVNAGICNIEFTYETPGAKLGLICTIGGAALLGIYLAVIYGFKRHKPQRYVHLYDVQIVDGVKAHNAYINRLSRQIFDSPERGEAKRGKPKKLEFPDVQEDFMDVEIYDFDNAEPLIKHAHITEHDEAYYVLKELEEKDKGDIE